MNTKKKIAVRKLLSGVLVLLGFTACDSDGPGNELCEYGTPSADYQVKGKVLDQTGKPIKGVQVVVKDLDAVFVKGENCLLYTSFLINPGFFIGLFFYNIEIRIQVAH